MFHEIIRPKFSKFPAEFFRKSTAVFPEIFGKNSKEISGNFLTHIPTAVGAS